MDFLISLGGGLSIGIAFGVVLFFTLGIYGSGKKDGHGTIPKERNFESHASE